jgi:hypothetical protein
MNGSVERPWTVALGCAVSLATSIWDVVSWVSEPEVVESYGFRALLLALAVIPVLFTLAAFFRRNWGRIVLAIVVALGFVSIPLLALFGEKVAELLDAETVLYSIAEVVFIVLLFMPASNAWYRRSRRSVI